MVFERDLASYLEMEFEENGRLNDSIPFSDQESIIVCVASKRLAFSLIDLEKTMFLVR